MKGIKHIFFDLDHTLWDYDRSAHETLSEIYTQLELSKSGLTIKKFVNTFYEVNNKLWVKYNDGLIDREYIKTQRFSEIFTSTGIDEIKSEEASAYFLNNCSQKPYLMEDALTALHYLSGKYELHIITNGFLDAQNRKLSSSGITKFFKVMVTSECSDSRKPSPGIFEYSLKEAQAGKSESIMIGDNPRTDIQGARDFGMKTVFYDPSGRKKSLADFTIQSHMELLKLL
ncbi:YjjG family noncanonical pyrimidine nucleotidase [Ekhidna sp. To15]|uniref:YjjG family noncanonical pyrimidine nucleotidase n=1 Tax=Ekhidna sp. To15 TaxID=3395267 RepID=UPI003F51EEA5